MHDARWVSGTVDDFGIDGVNIEINTNKIVIVLY